jgi:hypothetical protein
VKKYALAVTAAAAALLASAASAATYYNVGPVGADGGFTVVFGNLGINTPTFDDAFTFTVPTGPDGRADFSVSSTMSIDSQNIQFSSVTFNGLNFQVETNGWNESRFLNDVDVSAGQSYTLRLIGNAGVSGATPNASYSGVITFAPNASAVVPEPGTWALMIVGFGGAGAILRRRRDQMAPLAA